MAEVCVMKEEERDRKEVVLNTPPPPFTISDEEGAHILTEEEMFVQAPPSPVSLV